MSYIKHKDLISNFCDSNTLNDDFIRITYKDLSIILTDLDLFFTKNDGKDVFCLGLQVENSVLHAIIILYLICEEINFYLFPSHPQADKTIPPFCDKILVYKSYSDNRLDFFESIQIKKNHEHIEYGKWIQPKSALVFFSSSGTTGLQKYICHRKTKLIQNAKNCIRRFRLETNSRVLISVPVNHMYGFGVGLLPAFISSANISLIEKSNVVKLINKVKEFEPTISLINPTVARMLLMLEKKIYNKTLYISAGEKMNKITHSTFEENFGTLINLYGCTELGAIGTSPISDVVRRYEGIFLPLEGVQVRIDPVTSEILCIHAAGFECYVDRKGNLCFYGNIDGCWYHTRDFGLDIGRGNFTVSGRIDNCINIAGYIISLEDVELTLKGLFRGVKQVVVFEDLKQKNILVSLIAVCEVDDSFQSNPLEMKIICKGKMERHLIPDQFFLVANIPKLLNGKPDRFNLKNNYKQILN